MAKRKGGGGANWMDTYGDMVTLLLCFFVLLYSMSTISEENWKKLVQSFNPNAIQTETDPKGNDGPYSDPDIGDDNPGMEQRQIEDMMDELMAALQQYASSEGLDGAVAVSQNGGRIYVELMDKAMELANAICANAPIAVAESKRCIRMGMQTDIATGSAFEAEAFGVTCGTEDKNEGMGAFLEKRQEKHFQNK